MNNFNYSNNIQKIADIILKDKYLSKKYNNFKSEFKINDTETESDPVSETKIKSDTETDIDTDIDINPVIPDDLQKIQMNAQFFG